MILYDFNRLTQPERAEYVIENGEFLASCPGRGNLYKINDFFAEILYNCQSNEIRETRAFRTTKNLEPYLDQININLDKHESE